MNDSANLEGGSNGAFIDNPSSSDAKRSGSCDGWNAPTPEGSSINWNEANDSGNSKGWNGWGAKTGNWTGKRKNNPWTPPYVTAKRQRFELTTEERSILLLVQPIVHRVKRIFREAG